MIVKRELYLSWAVTQRTENTRMDRADRWGILVGKWAAVRWRRALRQGMAAGLVGAAVMTLAEKTEQQ